MSMGILAVANQKGGVGKTTTAVTLGYGLARHGYHVLLVDLDPQGHVSESLGIKKSPGLFRLLVDRQPLDHVVVRARENLDIISSDKTTERAKRYLASEPLSHKAIVRSLKNAPYDVVLFDCAPSYDILHIAALVASDRLLIPTRLEHLASDGVNELLRSAAELREDGESKVRLVCILPTFFERVTRETTEQLQNLVDQFGTAVWPPIPQDTKVREASAYGKTLWEYAATSSSIVGYPMGDGTSRIGGYETILNRLMRGLDLWEGGNDTA
jgi:chromosome partitioning protein